MPTLNRFRLLAAGLAATGLLLAGCSTSTVEVTEPPAPTTGVELSASPAAFIGQAAQNTADAGSARFTGQVSMGGSADGSMTMTMDGAIDFTDQQMEMTVNSGLFGENSSMQAIVSGGQTYVKMPMLGDKWIQAPAQDSAVAFSDPTEGLDTLKEAADLTEVGQEPVDGVPATHYTGTIDLQKALAQAGLPEEQLQEAEKQLAKAGNTAKVDVWVDEDGRVIKYSQTMSIDVGSGSAMDITVSMQFSDFGVATDISPPSDSEIVQPGDVGGLESLMPGAGA